jgi:hypothetical protein
MDKVYYVFVTFRIIRYRENVLDFPAKYQMIGNFIKKVASLKRSQKNCVGEVLLKYSLPNLV